jgi:ATP-dependent protease Clp ATPase subunit
MFMKRQLRCSFCRKTDAQVSKLVAGPRVYICDACVAIASRLIDDDSPNGGAANRVPPSVWRALVARSQRFIRRITGSASLLAMR